MLLLGVVQAQAAGDVSFGSYDLLATEILTSTAASVTFSSLGDYAANYQHLQLRFAARLDLSGSTSNVLAIRANGISSSSYSAHQLNGDGSVVESAAFTSATSMRLGRITAASATADNFGAGVIDILDPYSSSKNTTFRGFTGIGSELVTLYSGLFINTASITSLELLPVTSSNYISGSRFSLYGIKAV